MLGSEVGCARKRGLRNASPACPVLVLPSRGRADGVTCWEGGRGARRLLLPTPLLASPSRFNVWAVVFVVTRLFTLTLYILVIGFGLPRVENQALEPEKGNLFSFLFNNILFR